MASLFTTVLLFALAITQVSSEYRYYYRRPSSRELASKVRQLEEKVDSLQAPVHVHVHGDGEDHAAHAHLDGTHIHVHMSMDNTAPKSMDYRYATCNVRPNTQGTSGGHLVYGEVKLRQKPGSPLDIMISLRGFTSSGLYGFHVHEAANFKEGCNSFGGHFNPEGKVHGGPTDAERHVGDWGNLQADSGGNVEVTDMTDSVASLFGANTIVGRGIVIHAGTDDLGRGGDAGSRATGNAGARLACCVIGWSNKPDRAL